MPKRLIQIIIIFAVFLLFIVFNLGDDYKCNIWIFKTIHDVPVFLIAFFSFVLGMLCAIPFFIGHQIRKKREIEDKKSGSSDTASIPNSNHYGID